MKFKKGYLEKIEQLKEKIESAEAIVIGAGAGLSTSAGFTYSGVRFWQYFSDFYEKYHFQNMYEGGFYPFDSLEEYWAYWSRYIYINRYMDVDNGTYKNLQKLMKGRTVQVLCTNVDHQFQKAGFDKERLFYTQGDYGLFQCSEPCCQKTYDNEEAVKKMMEAQGYVLTENGIPFVPEGTLLKMKIPKEMIPYCPVCHKPMAMNLRADETFVEDEGWHKAADRYQEFLNCHRKEKVLFLELGVGYNTPGIIKYSFWRMVHEWKNADYICINAKEAYAPEKIRDRSICIQADIGEVLKQFKDPDAQNCFSMS